MPMLRRNHNDRSGSNARITAPQHFCPLHPKLNEERASKEGM